MKVIIIGNGKMGQAVAEVARRRGHEILHVFDENNIKHMSRNNLQTADIAFEFTQPNAAFDNIMRCFDSDLPVVCGTTGWLDKLPMVKERCYNEGKTLFYAPNFSIGMNVFSLINKQLSELMNSLEEYDTSIKEIHHIHKKDAPSGTAVKLAEDIIEVSERYQDWSMSKDLNYEELPIVSERVGEELGTHIVEFESDLDFIEIKHKLKTRDSLAIGAVVAGEFCVDKSGFLTMDDLLQY